MTSRTTALDEARVRRWTELLDVLVPKLRGAGLLGRRTDFRRIEELVRTAALHFDATALCRTSAGDVRLVEDLAAAAGRARLAARGAAAALGMIEAGSVGDPPGPDGEDADLRAWFDPAVPLVAPRLLAIAAADEVLVARLRAVGLPETVLPRQLARLRAAVGSLGTLGQVEVLRTNTLRRSLREAQEFLARAGTDATPAWDTALRVAQVLREELGPHAEGPDLEDPEFPGTTPGAGDQAVRDGGRA